ILLAAAIAIGPQVQFRPQLFTFMLTAAMLALLTRYLYRGSARLWLAIPMMALWANLHGGFIIGLAILFFFFAAGALRGILVSGGPHRPAMPFAIALCASVATFANPYGIGIWQAVLRALGNPHTRTIIDDWQSLPRSLLAVWQQNPIAAIPTLLGLAIFA